MRRLLTILAVAFLLSVAWWLTRSPVRVLDLGPGTRILTREGAEFAIVGDAAGHWRVVPASAKDPRSTFALPDGLRGWPVIDSEGIVHALHENGLVCLQDGAYLRKLELPRDPTGDGPQPPAVAPKSLSVDRLTLVGVDAADEPVLLWASPAGPRLIIHHSSQGADQAQSAPKELSANGGGHGWALLQTDEREARPQGGLELEQILLSSSRRAVAFLGTQGWEAWSFGSDGPASRRIATGCVGPRAVFSPSGDALIVDGKVKGLWRLELESGTLRFMAEGNLGHHERLPFAVGLREMPSEAGPAAVLVAPQRDQHGYLQIFQTHLSGGGRWSFGGGYVHHYAPAVSRDDLLLVYVQSEFDERSPEAPMEDLYLMAFEEPDRAAIHVAHRQGGRSGQGPVFVGQEDALMYIAGGRVKRLEIADG